MRSFIKIAIAVALTAFFATPSFAQATRTWVSGVGDDVNPCSRTAPCKTFAGAISKTAAGGEINVLDAGGFGSGTVTKSITIDGQGPMASLLAAGTSGVIVNGVGITVTLRNLTINGANTTAGNGIRVVNAAAVNIDRVNIQNFAGTTATTGRGIAIETSAANVRVTITNSDLYNNLGIGIHSNPTAGNVILVVDNVRVQKSDASLIQLRSNTRATIDRATLTNSRLGAGVNAELGSVVAHISNSTLANNAFGVSCGAGAPAEMALYQNVITGNTTDGIRLNGGTAVSFGNNAIGFNAGNETPSNTIPTR